MKSKKIKGRIAIIAAASIVGMLVAGCGKSSSSIPSSEPATSSTTSSIAKVSTTIALKSGFALDKTYDGKAVAIAAANIDTNNPTGEITFAFYNGTTLLTEAPKLPGDYSVKISIAASGNYLAAEASKTFTIAKKALTATGSSAWIANGKTFFLTLVGTIEGENVTAKADTTDSVPGTYTGETISEITLDGADKDNYTLAKTDVTVTIKVIPDSQIGFANDYSPAKIYDGKAATAPTSKDIKVNYMSTAKFDFFSFTTKWYDIVSLSTPSETPTELTEAPTKPGAYRVRLTLNATEYNSAGAVISREFEIAKKQLTINKSWRYNANTLFAFSLSTQTGVISGEKVNVSLNTSSASVGTYTGDNIKNLTVSGADKDNYSLSEANVTCSITKIDMTDTTGANKFTNDYVPGKAFDGTPATAPVSKNLKLDYSTSTLDFFEFTTKWYNIVDINAPVDNPEELTEAPIDVGDYRVVATITSNDFTNGGGTYTKDFQITPKAITKVAFTTPWANTDHYTIPLTEADGVLAADVGEVNATFETSNGTTSVDSDIGVYSSDDATMALNQSIDNNNYEWADDAVITLTVTQLTGYESRISTAAKQKFYAVKLPTLDEVFAEAVPSFVPDAKRSLYKYTLDGTRTYYASDDSSKTISTKTIPGNAYFGLQVESAGNANVGACDVKTDQSMIYYPPNLFTQEVTAGSSISAGYKATDVKLAKVTVTDIAKTHKAYISRSDGVTVNDCTLYVFDSDGKVVTLGAANTFSFSPSAAGTYYVILNLGDGVATDTSGTMHYLES